MSAKHPNASEQERSEGSKVEVGSNATDRKTFPLR